MLLRRWIAKSCRPAIRLYSTLSPSEASFSRSAPIKPEKKNLIGLTLDELKQEMAGMPMAKSYTARQIWSHLYNAGCTSIESLTCLPKTLRDQMTEKYVVDYGSINFDRVASDQTRKFLIGYNTRQDPGAVVETVLIPEKKRNTLCVSSQIGCSLRCSFCHTGTQKLRRNLTSAEIVGQYMIAAHRSDGFPLKQERIISNMVFMGQGEPLYNWKNVSKAVKILTDPLGLGMPKSKITISTSGVAPLIPKIASELGVSLAISLHATRNALRDELVPLNKTYPLDALLDACKEYTHVMGNRGRRITFEYVMLNGVNDSVQEASALVQLLKQLPAHVNLIPFNPWPGSLYRASRLENIDRFAKAVMEGGVHCTVRRPRGQDIMAACGQLKSAKESKAVKALS